MTATRDQLVEAGARALAGLAPGEEWPTNVELGGHALLGTRDDEYRNEMREGAAAVLDAVLPLITDYVPCEPKMGDCCPGSAHDWRPSESSRLP